MSTPDPTVAVDAARLAETVEYVALRRLQDAYADVVTRRAWPELAELFRPDCALELDLAGSTGRHVGPDAIGDFIATQLERFSFFEFVILNTVLEVDVAAGRAVGRLYLQELRQSVADGRRTDAFGVYHDRFERDPDGRWWFAHRRYGSYSRTAPDQDVFELPVHALDPDR